jgi:hypothetical protein
VSKISEMAMLIGSVSTSAQDFNDQGTYPCPACRLGQIQALSMMEAMACNTCRHIFTANLERQRLLTVDRSPPLVWHWNGRNWIGAHVQGVHLDWKYGLSAIAFVLLPPALIGLSALATAADDSLSPISIVWTGLTFLLHLALVGRLLLGFYQFPVRTYFSVIGRKLLSRYYPVENMSR